MNILISRSLLTGTFPLSPHPLSLFLYISKSNLSSSDLTPWAKSGVLLLNTCLTVKPSLAGSHSKKGWEEFTEKLIALVDRYAGAEEVGMNGKGIVVLAWGAWAEKKVKGLDKKKHLILTSAVGLLSLCSSSFFFSRLTEIITIAYSVASISTFSS